MSNSITILMAQINPNVGAINSNCDKIIKIINEHQQNYDLIIFPELALTGYQLQDLLLRQKLFTEINIALQKIQNSVTTSCHVIIGHPKQNTNRNKYNSASVFAMRQCVGQYNKQKLPNYGIFDERRYFTASTNTALTFTIKGQVIKLCICEDLWQSTPQEILGAKIPDILISINASPFEENKYQKRITTCATYAKHGCRVIYVNQVGGHDELIFDGGSFALDEHGAVKACAPMFVESLHKITINDNKVISDIAPTLSENAAIYQAITLGIKDYVHKNKFKGILLGLSGGIDSALCLALAVDAIGASKVLAVLLPSEYTASISNEDALTEINNLQVKHLQLPINNIFNIFLNTLPDKQNKNITKENLQARIRGTLLMALANNTDYMLISTSNKSEAAVGYSTLYGDMSGGFAPIKDVFKTKIFSLAKYRNHISPVIPERVITRAPSAELSPNQKDEDTLPKYEILDKILKLYIEDCLDMDNIISLGYPKDIVQKTIKLIYQSEHKRHQAPPGPKISTCAFGKDWRRPITHEFDLIS